MPHRALIVGRVANLSAESAIVKRNHAEVSRNNSAWVIDPQIRAVFKTEWPTCRHNLQTAYLLEIGKTLFMVKVPIGRVCRIYKSQPKIV